MHGVVHGVVHSTVHGVVHRVVRGVVHGTVHGVLVYGTVHAWCMARCTAVAHRGHDLAWGRVVVARLHGRHLIHGVDLVLTDPGHVRPLVPMWKARPVWPASAAQAAGWPRLAELGAA